MSQGKENLWGPCIHVTWHTLGKKGFSGLQGVGKASREHEWRERGRAQQKSQKRWWRWYQRPPSLRSSIHPIEHIWGPLKSQAATLWAFYLKEFLGGCPFYSCGTPEKPQEVEQQKCLQMGKWQRAGKLGWNFVWEAVKHLTITDSVPDV